MDFDAQHQAAAYEEKARICQRGYKPLLTKLYSPPDDIIFDTNVGTIVTGPPEQNNHGLDSINAVADIKCTCP